MNNKSDEKAKSAGNAINKLNTHTQKKKKKKTIHYMYQKKQKNKNPQDKGKIIAPEITAEDERAEVYQDQKGRLIVDRCGHRWWIRRRQFQQ